MSPSGTFDVITKPGEPGHHFVAVVALDLDDAILDGAAGAAEFLQLLRQGGDGFVRGGYTGDYCDCFSAAMLAVMHDTDDTVALFWQAASLPG
jgi:hypothetical protein